MMRLKEHLKNNLAIYLILFVCLVIILITLFVTRKNGEELEILKVDTSYFEVISLEETLDLFEKDETSFLVIGYETCTATINYVPYLQVILAKYGFKVYYLELKTVGKNDIENVNKLIDKLDMEYNFKGDIDKFGKFIESTPSTVIIKNNKQVFGYYGSMNVTTLETIAQKYGLIQDN